MGDEIRLPEPAWLVAMVDQRLTFMQEKMGGRDLDLSGQYVVTPVSEPGSSDDPNETISPEQMERWDRSCDRCGEYRPDDLYTGHVTREAFGTTVTFTFGVCPTCAELPSV